MVINLIDTPDDDEFFFYKFIILSRLANTSPGTIESNIVLPLTRYRLPLTMTSHGNNQ